MTFNIERTSDYGDTTNAPMEGTIKKDGNWIIEINSLDELMDLVNEQGPLVLSTTSCIEIYDTCRE